MRECVVNLPFVPTRGLPAVRTGTHNPQSGRLAQLGERRVRNAEVGSSSLLPSTNLPKYFRDF
jgi:hypothetical protein